MIAKNYPESIEESGNYLRIALKNITNHKLPYNPITYSLWYEYALGRDEKLLNDIDALMKKQHEISFTTIQKLFEKHMADGRILIAEMKTKEFTRIIAEMVKQLGVSGGDLKHRGNKLERCANEISTATSMEAVSEIANQMVVQTKSVVKSTEDLQYNLYKTASELKNLKQEIKGLRQQAKTDMLTGLLNRRGFDEAMAAYVKHAKSSHDPCSIILLDIDHFKKINDTYGHLVGDNVLKMLSRLLKDFIKGNDTAARFGGEEFILLLPGINLDGAYALAEKIRIFLAEMQWKSKDTGQSIGSVTISLGIAQYKDNEAINSFIKRADDALYYAKNNGRNRTVMESEL